MDISNEQLKKAIMRRVYLAYVVRRVFHAVTMKTAAIAFFTWIIFLQVSVGNVVANAKLAAPSASFYRFFGDAFINTEFLVQALVIGIFALGGWLAHDLYRTWGRNNGNMITAR